MSSTPETGREPQSAEHSGAASVEVAVERWQSGRTERLTDRVAEETPVALVYHGVPHVVMLATPANLEDYAVGFTVSEGLVANADEIHSVEVIASPSHPNSGAASSAAVPPNSSRADSPAAVPAEGIEIRIGIAQHRFSALLQRRRNLTGRTGCGLCGTETLEQAMRPVAPVAADLKVSVADLHRALESLGALQPVNSRTGSVHAAAWVLPGQGIQFVREDVGRHNALDKAIGALIRSGQDVSRGYMVITSRASYEMVQKSAAVGVALLAAVSAPTALAIRTAEQAGITLVGFARTDRHVVYCHSHRLA